MRAITKKKNSKEKTNKVENECKSVILEQAAKFEQEKKNLEK